MITTHPFIKQHQQAFVALCQSYWVQRLEVFVFAAPATAFSDTTSDVDYLV